LIALNDGDLKTRAAKADLMFMRESRRRSLLGLGPPTITALVWTPCDVRVARAHALHANPQPALRYDAKEVANSLRPCTHN